MDFALPTGQTLAVDRHGPADAPMVVLLHGVSGNRRGYGVLIDHLIGRVERCDLQVINVDLRGHGQSSRATLATYDAPSYATGIAALIDSLTDRERSWSVTPSADCRSGAGVDAARPGSVAAVRDLHAKGAPLSDYETLALTHVAPVEAAARGDSLSLWDSPACRPQSTAARRIRFTDGLRQ